MTCDCCHCKKYGPIPKKKESIIRNEMIEEIDKLLDKVVDNEKKIMDCKELLKSKP